jgi:hypothetical protein
MDLAAAPERDIDCAGFELINVPQPIPPSAKPDVKHHVTSETELVSVDVGPERDRVILGMVVKVPLGLTARRALIGRWHPARGDLLFHPLERLIADLGTEAVIRR